MLLIHPEGKFILFFILPVIIFLGFTIIKPNSKRYFFWSTINVIIYLFTLFFFRNPTRAFIKNDEIVLSPADGTVLDITPVYEEEYFKAIKLRISIFMSPLNIHVNRNPITGNVKYFKYHRGKYLIAFYPKSSIKNERTSIVIQHATGSEILFRQIAGFIARRICYYVREGQEVLQAEECGFIKFGSRVDVFLPITAEIYVKEKDKVTGGITPLSSLS